MSNWLSFLQPRRVGRLARAVFGEMNYSPPSWPRSVFDTMQRHPGRWAATIVFIGTALGGYIKGNEWWQAHKPKPRQLVEAREVSISYLTPNIAKVVEGIAIPEGLTLKFSTAAARLDQVKTPNPAGITLSPSHPGRWVWETDKLLAFKPSADWPPGAEFTVTLEPSQLANEVKLKDKPSHTFHISTLAPKWSNLEFYTNPKAPEEHEITAALSFTHPMALSEVEKHINLRTIGGSVLFPSASKSFIITEDKEGAQRRFYVRSAKIALPDKEDFVALTFTKGASSTLGGALTSSDVIDKVRVPDIYSGFTIAEVTTELIRTSEGEPEQFLFIDTNGYATPEVIAKHLKAWFLPDSANIVNTNYWTTTGDLTSQCASIVKPVTLKLVETEKDEGAPLATRHGFKFLNEQPGQLLVQVQRGATALGGFILGRTHTANVVVPDFPKEVELLGKGGILALNGERKLSVKSRGVKHLRITLGRVPSSQVNHLARFNQGTFEMPEFNYMIDEEHLAHFHREVVEVPIRNDYQAAFSTFDFSAALAREDSSDLDKSRGMFFLMLEGVEPRPVSDEESDDADPLVAKWREMEGAADGRFILVTDLGLIAKVNEDHTRDMFVQSVSKGEPLAAVTIAVLAKNGEFIAQATTDAQGHTVLPNLDMYRREKEPVAITARLGNDLAFMPFRRHDRRLELSRFDTDGVVASEQKNLRAFVFTERGVYRPGDTIHVGTIVRRRDWQGELANLPLEMKVYDAKGDEVKKEAVNLPADGFLDWTTSTAESDPTGVYEVTVSRIITKEGREQIGRVAFRVEDFQPDRMKMAATLNKPSSLAWIPPTDVKATIKLETLFGTAAADRRVVGKLDLSPASFHFDQFADFTFHNRKAYEFKRGADEDESAAGKKVDLGELKTNDKGEAEFDLALERFDTGSFAMRFAAEAFEADGGRSVQAATSVMVSSMPYVVGHKAPSQLDYIGQDTPLALKFLCIGPDLKPMNAPALKARIIRARYVSVLTKQENGNYEYVSTRREKIESENAFTLPAAGAELSLPTNTAGEHRLEVRDGDTLVSVCSFTIVGKGDPGRSLERDAELELKLARRDWNSDESIAMNFNAPYTGAGLITIEREKVLAWQWFKSPTTSVNASILVPPGMEGTGYVSVAYVRALDSPEIFTSPLSYAVHPFMANKDARKLAVTLTAPERVKPGEKLHIGYTSALPGRVVIFAVDEGIHQITNYKLPQPLTHFLEKRALEVDTYQLLDLILPEFSMVAKQSAYGGDDDALRVSLNPFKRKREAPVVFWSGIVASGPQAKEVVYDVPDYFDGRLKIMAVAVTDKKLGSAETQSLVRGPMVLTPNVPTFVAPGDEFTASLSVANNLDSANEVQLKVQASEHLELLDAAESKLAVAPGKEATTRFRFKARDKLGGAEITFTSSAGTESVTRRATLSVRPAAPYLTDVQSGYFRLGKQDVKLTREVYPHFRKAEAVVSALPLGLARGLEAYLADYPHGCSEQITSRAMSRLLLMTEADFGFDQAESAAQLQSALRLLTTRQNSDGGFGYWPGDATTDYLSVYVTTFLTEAKEASHALPAGLLDGALNRMKQIARAKDGNAQLQAAAIYLLTRNGEVTSNYVLNLRDTLEQTSKGKWQSTLTGAYLASTYALLQKRNEADSIMRTYWNAADKSPKLSRWYYDWFNEPQVQQAQGFTLLCRHFPDIAKGLSYDDLKMITDPIRVNHFNTYSAAWGVLALKSYSKLAQQANVKLSIQSLPASGSPAILAPEGTGLRRTKFDAGTPGLRFLLDKNGSDLGAFYQVAESGFDKSPPTKVIADGLEVVREIVDAQGKPVSEVAVGEVATVRIRVRNISPEPLSNIAVLDLLPGGFLLAPNGLKPGRGTVPGATYVDVREDRTIFFTDLGKAETKTFSYGIKPVCVGTFKVPPVFAECMYDRGVKGRSGGGAMEVK